MAVTAERFRQGMSYEEVKTKLPRNLPQIEANESRIKLSEADLAPWRNLPQNYNVLVLVIDPCPDVYTNLPILNKIAQESGKLNLSFFMRDDNKDLMSHFMNGPYESVPVFAFFDQDFNLRSVFIERPKSVTNLRAEKTREIHERNSEFGPVGTSANQMTEDVRGRYQAAINQMRSETSEYYIGESVRELGEIAKELATPPATAKWRGNLVAVPA
jgi:hypothetical protein